MSGPLLSVFTYSPTTFPGVEQVKIAMFNGTEGRVFLKTP